MNWFNVMYKLRHRETRVRTTKVQAVNPASAAQRVCDEYQRYPMQIVCVSPTEGPVMADA